MLDAIYIHIPFCKRKCHYCDFFILTQMENEYKKYVDYLIKEIKLYRKYRFDTIYFGGGTPSVLEVSDIKKILNELNYDENSEITLEVNPNDISLEKLKELRKAGINRLSIGIQSFNQNQVLKMNRTHTCSDSITTYFDAIEAGFSNISIDLIFALPNETLEEVKFDMEIIKKIRPNHISIYSLIWENGTMFMKRLKEGKLTRVDEDKEADMFKYIIDTLKSYGYEHYEISSFSLDDKKGRHNKKYWKNLEYIGVGISASGYVDNIRYTNTRSLVKYYKMIDEKKRPIDSKSIENITEELKNKYQCILSFRMLDEGISKEYVDCKIAQKLIEDGYIYSDGDRLKLTQKGIFLSNDVLENFV